MASVMTTGVITLAISEAPQIAVAWAPTPIAPTVWAMVFSVRMADSGRSMSALKRCSDSPGSPPSCTLAWVNDGVMLNSTASQIEHRNENMMDMKKNAMSSVYMKMSGADGMRLRAAPMVPEAVAMVLPDQGVEVMA